MPGYSDYKHYVRDGQTGPVANTPSANDTAMERPSNPVSDAFNWGVGGAMDWLGHDVSQRPAGEDNDFYREYAQYMPGYDINGVPSGAIAQDRATNHVGHGTGPGNPWDNVRRSLVEQQSGMVDSRLAAGEDPNLSFGDVYGAHENAYRDSGGGGNQFIDPASFGLAMYGAPLLDAVGIDSGPFTGASIDIFNDPTDSATEGWAKRMGLAGAEMGAGMAMMPLNPIAGMGLMGLGAFTGIYNTYTAVADGGMLGEWGDAIGDVGSDIWDGGADLLSGAGDAIGGAASAVGDVASGIGSSISSAGSAVGSFVGGLLSGW